MKVYSFEPSRARAGGVVLIAADTRKRAIKESKKLIDDLQPPYLEKNLTYQGSKPGIILNMLYIE